MEVCRIEDSAVTIKAMDDKKIVVGDDDRSKLVKWNINGLAYEKCVGFYLDGNTDRLLSSDEIFLPTKEPYSEDPSAGGYS